MYRLMKQANGSAHGTFLPLSASFMKMYDKRLPSSADMSTLEALPIIEQGSTDLNISHLLHNPVFALFAAQAIPELQMRKRYLGKGSRSDIASYGTCLVLPRRTLLTFFPDGTSWQIEVRGSEYLWSRLQELLFLWKQKEKLTLENIQVTVNQKGEVSFLF